MIPRTFPSTFALNGQQQMVVHFLTSVEGLEKWADYIPVKLEQGGPENSYSGCIDVVAISELTADTQAWKEYIPVHVDDEATDTWTVNNVGYIPYNFALFAEAAMQLDLTNGADLDYRVTFNRTTNATVTGPDGLIAYAPHNLLTFSEQFDNVAWGKNAATVTANTTTAPDGALTADTLTAAGTAGTFQVVTRNFVNTAAGTFTASVYIKAGTASTAILSPRANQAIRDTFAAFNLATGTVSESSLVTASIVLVSDGWYRCSISYAAPGGFTNLASYCVGFDFGEALGSTLFIWGAQLEISSTAREYYPTTVKNLLGFTEHFDNAAWTKSNSFVQTNLLLRSEEFDNAAWTKIRVSVTANTIVAPDGTLTGDQLIPNTESNTHFTELTTTSTTNTNPHTASVYVKSAGYSRFRFRMVEGSPFSRSVSALFNLTTGDFSTLTSTSGASASSASITDVGNGWYRCSITSTLGGASTIIITQIQVDDGSSLSFEGDGTSGISLWGAQLVQGATPGDYQRTTSAVAAVGYPDIYGQPFAQKLVENTASGVHVISGNHSATAIGTYTYTLYAKSAGENRLLELHVGNGISGAVYAFFDLDAGIVKATATSAGTGFSAISASITPANDSFYRCAISFEKTNTTGSVNCAARLSNGAFNLESVVYTGDGTSGIFIFGAQLSDSASVDPYVYQPVAAPASTAYYGPRFDYDPMTLAPKGLLIEEQRTNLLLRSEEFETTWAANALTVQTNQIVAPSGALTGDLLLEVAATTTQNRIQTISLTSGTTYTFSLYAKAQGRTAVQLGGSAGSFGNNVFATFDLINGVAANVGTQTTATISPAGNGWYRCSITGVATATGAGTVFIQSCASLSELRGESRAGDPTKGIFVWGAQLE